MAQRKRSVSEGDAVEPAPKRHKTAGASAEARDDQDTQEAALEPSTGLPVCLFEAVCRRKDWALLSPEQVEQRLKDLADQADQFKLSGQQRCQLVTELGRHSREPRTLIEAIYAFEIIDMWASAHGFEDNPYINLAYAIACPGRARADDNTLLAGTRNMLRYMFEAKLHLQQPDFSQ